MNRRGVMLLELLAAVTLLSLLTTGVLLAMRVGFNATHMTNDRILETRRVLSVQRILEQQIAGLMPVLADCQAPPFPRAMRRPFFQGDPQSMRFVSAYSLGEASRGYPRVLEYQVIPGENQEGVRLVVNEHLYTGPQSAGWFCPGATEEGLPVGPGQYPPIQAGPGSFVLADRLAYCRFLYREFQPPDQQRWLPAWPGITWPTGVRIEMAPLEAQPSRPPLVSITAPVRVTRMPFQQYADMF